MLILTFAGSVGMVYWGVHSSREYAVWLFGFFSIMSFALFIYASFILRQLGELLEAITEHERQELNNLNRLLERAAEKAIKEKRNEKGGKRYSVGKA